MRVLLTLQAGRRFQVLVADSRPLFEGRRTLTALLRGGVRCTYLHANALAYGLRSADKARACVCAWAYLHGYVCMGMCAWVCARVHELR